MRNKLEDLPNEVIEAMFYTSGHIKYCGSEKYKQIMDTIEKYPQYFPWETLYYSIPEEVHEKYGEKLFELEDKFYPKEEPKPYDSKFNIEQLKEIFNEVYVNQPKIKREFEVAKKKLWNEHYKKYKLKYRE